MVRKKWLEPALTDLNVKRTENFGNGFYANTISSNSDSSCSSNDKDCDTYKRSHGLL